MKALEMKIGNSIVEIYDDRIVGPEEVEKILKRIGSIGTGKVESVQDLPHVPKSKGKKVKLA